MRKLSTKGASQPHENDKARLTVDDAFKQAVAHFTAKRYIEADKLCSAILQTTPKHLNALNLLGVIAQTINRHDLAIEQFRRAIAIDGNSGLLYYNLGISLYTSGHNEEAVAALKTALQKEPGNSQIATYLQNITETPPATKQNNSMNALHKGLELHQSGRLDEAIRCYKEALAFNPKDIDAISNMGTALQTLGNLDAAAACYRKAIAIKPDFPDAQFNLGNPVMKQGQTDAAVVSYQKAIAIEPDYVHAQFNLGNAWQTQGKLDAAADCYQKVLAIAPEYADAYSNLGMIFMEQGQLDAAIGSLQKAINLNPVHAEALSNLGNALMEQGKLDEAVEKYHQAIAIRPDYATAHSNLGNALQKQGKLDAAVTCYHKAIAINPDHAESYCNLGTALTIQGKIAAGVQFLETAVQMQPANKNLITCLIYALNYYTPNAETRSDYVKAQDALRLIRPEYTDETAIADDTVRQLYQQCKNVVASHGLDISGDHSQIYRGSVGLIINGSIPKSCLRHSQVFEKLQIIPEECFYCYKVTVKPRTVLELFKLLLVFDTIELPRDATRKCIVEVRPEISGTYKGFVYCQNHAESKKIVKLVQNAVGDKISNKVPVSIKRGCSEYLLTYPEFEHSDADGSPVMSYKDEWRTKEEYADDSLAVPGNTIPSDTYNHVGFTLRDVQVMDYWLAYAAMIGDSSYLQISGTPITHKLSIPKRPPFQPMDE